jgi:NAD-dependent deacetylase
MNKILIFTGAGLSAESGISTFRDNEDGLWTRYDPSRVANMLTFHSNKTEVFQFYNERRLSLSTLKPNAAHFGIAAMQKKYGKDNVKIFTQNIDDFLEQAGCEDVVHVHGEITKMMCMHCGNNWDIGYAEWFEDQECPHCDYGASENYGTSVKPGVVFFHEQAPEYYNLFKTFKESRNDTIIVIGTSGNIIDTKKITGNRYSTNKSFTILNNKIYDKYSMINYKDFDLTIFEPASVAIERIMKVVDERHANIQAISS